MQQKYHTKQQGIANMVSMLRHHANLFKGKFSTILNNVV